SLLENRHGIADRLKAGAYRDAALVPASPWLDATPPAPPRVIPERSGAEVKLHLAIAPGKPATRYAIWTRTPSGWSVHVVPTTESVVALDGRGLDRVVVSSVDRLGNESGRVYREIAP